jgi:hypothetical protein
MDSQQNLNIFLKDITIRDENKNEIKPDSNNATPDVHHIIDKLTEFYGFPEELKTLLLMVQSKTDIILFDDKFYFESIEELKKNHMDNINLYKQFRWIDLGVMYGGLGWFFVVSWDKQTRKFFMRLDGGSNGYDRMENHEFYWGSDSKPPKFVINEKDDKLYDFNQMFDHIKNNQGNEMTQYNFYSSRKF